MRTRRTLCVLLAGLVSAVMLVPGRGAVQPGDAPLTYIPVQGRVSPTGDFSGDLTIVTFTVGDAGHLLLTGVLNGTTTHRTGIQTRVTQQTFTAPGKVDYVCTIHPGMEGTITVRVRNDAPAVAGDRHVRGTANGIATAGARAANGLGGDVDVIRRPQRSAIQSQLGKAGLRRAAGAAAARAADSVAKQHEVTVGVDIAIA